MLHPLIMFLAYWKLFRRLPDLAVVVGIIVHDWGYWGKKGIDSQGGEDHPYLGARIMRALFGERGWKLAIGHSDNTTGREGVPRSVLYTVDKYYYCLIPVWLHRLLGTLSGEYREIEADPVRSWDPFGYKQMMKSRFSLSGDLTVNLTLF
jgi:hypothetical protein